MTIEEQLKEFYSLPSVKHDHFAKLWKLAFAVGKCRDKLPTEIETAYLELKADECNDIS